MTASSTNSTSSLQLLALQEELTDLRDRNEQLNSRLRQREADFGALRKQLEFVAAEKERLRSKVRDLEANLDLVPASLPIVTSPTHELEGGCGGPRMAERKRLVKIEDVSHVTEDDLEVRGREVENQSETTCTEDSDAEHWPRVTGFELSKQGVRIVL